VGKGGQKDGSGQMSKRKNQLSSAVGIAFGFSYDSFNYGFRMCGWCAVESASKDAVETSRDLLVNTTLERKQAIARINISKIFQGVLLTCLGQDITCS
jgi:hypothetical protein